MERNTELASVLVPRLFVEFAVCGDLSVLTIAAVHDWLYHGGIRHDAMNAAAAEGIGPASMADFLVSYTAMAELQRAALVRDVTLPLWFADNKTSPFPA